MCLETCTMIGCLRADSQSGHAGPSPRRSQLAIQLHLHKSTLLPSFAAEALHLCQTSLLFLLHDRGIEQSTSNHGLTDPSRPDTVSFTTRVSSTRSFADPDQGTIRSSHELEDE